MKAIKRKFAILLAACLVITSVVPAFAEEIEQPVQVTENAEETATETTENQEITEAVNEIVAEEASSNEAAYESETSEESDDDIEEASPSDAKQADSGVFVREVTVEGVKVKVEAPEGTFPADAELSVTAVDEETVDENIENVEEKIDEAVEDARKKDKDLKDAKVLSSLKFDIKIVLPDGTELQPEGNKVKVTFTLAEKVGDCVDINVYHLKEVENTKASADTEASDVSLKAEKVEGTVKTVPAEETAEAAEGTTAVKNVSEEVDEEGILADGPVTNDVNDEVTEFEGETDGFSYYTVEFTYEELQYVLPGDSSIALSDILAQLKIEGTVADVEVSNPELFSADKDVNGVWRVTAHQAFSTDEWMKLTMDDESVYEIVVTDDPAPENVCKIGSTGYATLEAAILAVTNGKTITMLQDVTYGTPLTINNGKTFTIDFDDSSSTHTFKWDVTVGQAYQQDIIIIEGNSNVTVNNMEFLVGGTDEQGNRIFKVNSTGKLTLNNMTLNSEDSIKNTPVQNNGGTVVIDGGNITTKETNHPSISPNALNPIVQNLGGTTTFTGNGTYTMRNTSTGAAWLGRVITMSNQSTDADSYNECGTVIIENGTFNTGHIVDVNGKGTITINDATYGTGNGPIIKTFLGGIKSNITINNITTSAMFFSQVIEDLQTKINFQNGNVKYKPNYFCFRNNETQQMTSVSIKNGKFGPNTGSDDIHDEINNLLASGAKITALTSDPDGYTYQVKTETGTFIELQNAINSTSSADTLKLEKDYTAQSDEGPITIESGKSITIDLNGHTIDRGLNSATSSGNVITVKGTLTVEDNSTAGTGKITGGKNTTDGGGVIVDGGSFIFKGGSITGNTTNTSGGGVKINTNSTFTMNGGNITKNTASSNGGGVYVSSDATFIMNSGNIVDNKASGSYSSGGGVYMNSTFIMNGGNITENKAGSKGGGVFNNNGKEMTVGGTSQISGNLTGSTTNNVYLLSEKYITIATGDNKPQNGMSIGVTTNVIPTENKRVKITTNGTTDDVKYFSADNDAYEVKLNGNYLELAVKTTPSHTHTFTYAASNNKLTATCTAGCNEGYDTNPLTLTLTAPKNLVYDGNPKGVAFTYDEESRWRSAGLKLPGIIYYIKPSGQSGYELMEGLPTDAGDYMAEITVEQKTAQVKFAIEKAASKSLIVTFIYRNGKENTTTEVLYNEKVSKPSDPKMEGYTFVVWCSDAKCEKEYDFSTPVIDNLPLYARWRKDAGTKGNVRTEDKVVEINVQTVNPEEIELIADIKKNTSGSIESADSLADAVKNKVKEEATKNGKDVILFIDTQLTGIKVETERTGETEKATTTLTYDATPWMSTIDSEGKVKETRKIDNNDLNGNITLRLPVPASITEKYVNIVHESDGYPTKTYKNLEIVNKGTDKAYVEIKISHFSSFELTFSNEKSIDPVPYNGNSGSGSTSELFTGRPGNPVTNGTWNYYPAIDKWTYTTSRKFTNTWAYIANPYAGNEAAWFYFDEYGYMLTGWQKLYWNGAYRWFYFSKTKDANEGKCQLGGITPDGYALNPDGSWKEN